MYRKLAGVALALTIASGANAAIVAGNGVNNPDLFLAVWDSTAPNTLLQHLNLKGQDFAASPSFSPIAVDLTPIGGASANLRWAVVTGAASSTFLGLYYTASSTFDTNVFPGTNPSPLGNAVTQLGALVNTSAHAGNMPGTPTISSDIADGAVPGLQWAGQFDDGAATIINPAAPLNTTQAFYSSILSFTTGLTATGEVLANAFWSFDGTTLQFSADAPIPLPAGVWLLGSALLGLVGIARRQRAAA